MTSNSKNCCRLCLAPENECVEIFRTKAADKQPIQTKITACLHIQVCTHWFFILPTNEMNHLEVEATTHVVQCVGKIDNVSVQCGDDCWSVTCEHRKKYECSGDGNDETF